jgi:hypothetical protein
MEINSILNIYKITYRSPIVISYHYKILAYMHKLSLFPNKISDIHISPL